MEQENSKEKEALREEGENLLEEANKTRVEIVTAFSGEQNKRKSYLEYLNEIDESFWQKVKQDEEFRKFVSDSALGLVVDFRASLDKVGKDLQERFVELDSTSSPQTKKDTFGTGEFSELMTRDQISRARAVLLLLEEHPAEGSPGEYARKFMIHDVAVDMVQAGMDFPESFRFILSPEEIDMIEKEVKPTEPESNRGIVELLKAAKLKSEGVDDELAAKAAKERTDRDIKSMEVERGKERERMQAFYRQLLEDYPDLRELADQIYNLAEGQVNID